MYDDWQMLKKRIEQLRVNEQIIRSQQQQIEMLLEFNQEIRN